MRSKPDGFGLTMLNNMRLSPEQEAYRIQRVREAFKRMGPRPQQWRDNQSAAIKISHNTPEVRAKLSAATKAAFESGRYKITPEGKKNRDAALAIGHATAAKRINDIRPLAIAKLKGSNGFGKTQRGKIDHANCKEWCVLSPAGIQYKFSNLLEWCRQNESLFVDNSPGAKWPLWRRAAHGITEQGCKRGQRCSWGGWVLQNVWEKRDPIARNVATLIEQ